MEKIVVCDDFVGDPLTDVVAELSEVGEVRFLRISDFLEEEGFQYDNGRADLVRGESRIGGSSEKMILDRVVELSPKTVDKISGADNALQRGQILSRYAELLAQYHTPVPEMRYSTVGKLHPLPTQWHLIKNAALPVETPSYVYGYGPTPIETSDMRSPVFKSAFDLYRWKANEPQKDEQPWDQFAADVPVGTPVITYFLGAAQYTASLREFDGNVPDEARDELFTLMSKIRHLFGAPQCGEILWYVDKERYTFAAFSHFLSGCSMMPSFEEQAREFLDHYFTRDSMILAA